MTKAIIRKDNSRPSKPWTADLHFDNGDVWVSWMYNFALRTILEREIDAVDSNVECVRVMSADR